MAGEGNILIADGSAFHALMHGDWAEHIEASAVHANPLRECATDLENLRAFNVHNPLYGPPPISLLVGRAADRRYCGDISCRYTSAELPPCSFFELRRGLLMATPEFLFIRMARFASEAQLAEIGMNLCGRYFIDSKTGAIRERRQFITTPEKLKAFAISASRAQGSKKALQALRWVLPNSGSPYESKMKLVFCHPLGRGGCGLPFTAMNYDVSAGRLRQMTKQGEFSIDLAEPTRKVGMEYDGKESHEDASHDKRRRNELTALGWTIVPIDKSVLHDCEETVRTAQRVAKIMGVRFRRSEKWEGKYLRLRKELGLPMHPE